MSTPLWTKDEIAAATGGRIGAGFEQASGASIDTRTLKDGDLFFAVTGDARDGHEFVRSALENGASAAVVAEARAGDFADSDRLIVVPDVLAAMTHLGRAARARSSAKIVAVTGSVGKTGTKEALRLALSSQGKVHASVASYNNHWGVPLTLTRMPRDADFGIFEIGMNHAGEILPLTAMVRPHVAVVTTIESVHIEFFPSLYGIADAKGEIFSGLEPGGVAVINVDTPYYERLRAHAQASRAARVITFGKSEVADVRALQIQVRADESLVRAAVFGIELDYTIGTAGRHIALNSLSVLGTAYALGLDMAAISRAFALLRPPVGRGERTVLQLGGGEALLIDESYNANPASVRAALANLGAVELAPGGRRIAVLGDMRELGEQGPQLHRDMAATVDGNKVDMVFAAGDLMELMIANLKTAGVGLHTHTAEELVDAVVTAVRPGDVITVKGSLSMKMALIVRALKDKYGARESSDAVQG
jgi:UDP-N-acetylmuramoyl-tripeptide--D-alanyl-D-alanine ligase